MQQELRTASLLDQLLPTQPRDGVARQEHSVWVRCLQEETSAPLGQQPALGLQEPQPWKPPLYRTPCHHPDFRNLAQERPVPHPELGEGKRHFLAVV